MPLDQLDHGTVVKTTPAANRREFPAIMVMEATAIGMIGVIRSLGRSGYPVLNSGSASDDEKYDYLNATLEPIAGKFMIEEFGFGSANKLAFNIADKQLMEEFGYTDPQSLIKGSVLFDTFDPSVREKASNMFEELKAGF